MGGNKNLPFRHFITCTELSTYGNQQQDGDGRRESDNFFAFSNAIFHFVDGVPRIDYANELGVVEHNGENFYLPAFSTIHAERRGNSDAYENIRPLFYKDIPIEKTMFIRTLGSAYGFCLQDK